MSWFRRLFSKKSTTRVTARNPLIIDSPRIAFLNLVGHEAEPFVAEDKQAFGDLFTLVETPTDGVPNCDVLLIYSNITADGGIAGGSLSLRSLIDSASAAIVIIAWGNNGDCYTVPGNRNEHKSVNLVMTLDRKDKAFSQFFGALFRRMFKGESMLSAWVELAPQHVEAMHDDCPETILIPEISHIVFRDP